jgi:site-specific recombinase XerD
MTQVKPLLQGEGRDWNEEEELASWKRRRVDYMADFASYLTDELGRSPLTARGYSYALRCISRWAEKPPWEITASDLRAFKRHTDYSPATKQHVVVAVHAFHEWGVLEEHWKLNGLMAVKTPKTPFRPRPPISSHSARILLENCSTPLEYRVVYLGLYSGCRISESTNMDRSHDHGDRLTFIGKGGKTRTVPIHPELKDKLPTIWSIKPASVGVLQSAMQRLRDKFESKDLEGRKTSSHSLRRTFATTMYDAGVPFEVVARLLGHGEDVTALYARISFDRLKDAVSQVDYYGGEPVQLALF